MQNAIWNLNDSNFQIPSKVVWLEVEVFFSLHLSVNLSRSLSIVSVFINHSQFRVAPHLFRDLSQNHCLLL